VQVLLLRHPLRWHSYLVPASLNRAERELAEGFSFKDKCSVKAQRKKEHSLKKLQTLNKRQGVIRQTNCVSNWVFERNLGNGIVMRSPLKHPRMRKLLGL